MFLRRIAQVGLAVFICLSVVMLAGCDAQAGGVVSPDIDQGQEPLRINTGTVGPFVINTPISIQLQASGGRPNQFGEYVWSMSSSEAQDLFAAGYQVNSKGLMTGSGIAFQSNFEFDITVTDFSSPTRSTTRSVTFQVTDINGNIPNLPPSFVTTTLPVGKRVHQEMTQYSLDVVALDNDSADKVLTFLQPTITPQGAGVPGANIQLQTTGDQSTRLLWDGMTEDFYNVTIQVQDSANPPVSITYCVNVTATGTGPECNQPPQITSANPAPSPTTRLDVQATIPFQFQILATDPEGNDLQYSITQGNANMSVTSQNSSAIPAVQGGLFEWTALQADVGTQPDVVIEIDDQSGNVELYTIRLNVLAGPPVPSDVRVFVGNQHVAANPIEEGRVRNIEELDPAIPSPTGGPTFLDTDIWFQNGSHRLALTGPRHNLRVGGDIPVVKNLNTNSAYVQTPTFKVEDPNNPGQAIDASARLYIYNDLETISNETGTADVILAIDTLGNAIRFEFQENIHEEIYVPHNFASLGNIPWDNTDAFPMFVATSEDGTSAYVCRLDHQNIPGGLVTNGAMMQIDLPGTATVYHQTMTLLGQSVANAGPGNGNYLLWFSADDGGGDVLCRAPIINSSGNPTALAEVVTLDPGPAAGAVATDLRISTHFAPSGNGERLSIVVGNDLTTNVTTANFPTPATGRLWRDIWVIDGTLPVTNPDPTSRVTYWEDNASLSHLAAPGTVDDWRLIEVYDGFLRYSGDFVSGDSGHNDARVMFAEVDRDGDNTAVGHVMNYTGSLVAYVVNETNGGNGDGASEFAHDEVYVSSTLAPSATAHQEIVRLTADNAPNATDDAGDNMSGAHQFNVNMGVCTGLAFPMKSGGEGRDTRLVFGFALFSAQFDIGGNLVDTNRAQMQNIYTSEFTLGAGGALTHQSTADRSNGFTDSATLPGGYRIINADLTATRLRNVLGTTEGAFTSDGKMIFVVQGGSGTPATAVNLDADSLLMELDLTVTNANVSPVNGVLRPMNDIDGNDLRVFGSDEFRTHLSSGFEAQPPYNTTTIGGLIPHISTLFHGVHGHDATEEEMADTLFVSCRVNSGEQIFRAPLARTTIADQAINLSNIATNGNILRVFPSWDGKSIAFLRGGAAATQTNTLPLPDYRFATAYDEGEMYVISSIAEAVNGNNLVPLNFSAQPLTMNPGDQFAPTATWVDTRTISGNDTREFWWAIGIPAATPTANHNVLLTVKSQAYDLLDPLQPGIGNEQDVDQTPTPGAVFFYGSGVLPN